MSNLIIVGISDFKIAQTPDVLITYALGSCVGTCLYDSQIRLAGMSHILNVWSVKNQLQQLGIKLIAEDTGENYGRTVEFHPEDGSVIVKSVKRGSKLI